MNPPEKSIDPRCDTKGIRMCELRVKAYLKDICLFAHSNLPSDAGDGALVDQGLDSQVVIP